ncbi:MAG: hypothetical protein ABI856_17330, partial [Nitrospira sp.]
MNQDFPLTDRILEAVGQAPGCRIEELASLLPDLTWYQVFREVDRLSQAGHVRLLLDGRGIFTVRGP